MRYHSAIPNTHEHLMCQATFAEAERDIKRLTNKLAEARDRERKLRAMLSAVISHLEGHFHSPYCQISDSEEDEIIERAKSLLSAEQEKS